MKSHFNDLSGLHPDDAPIVLPDLAGRTIKTAELIHGTESGELVLLMGEGWHATIHHNHNQNGQPYLSAAFYQAERESTGEKYAAVTQLDELQGVTITRAESVQFQGAAAVSLDTDSGARTTFVAGSEPGTIDISREHVADPAKG